MSDLRLLLGVSRDPRAVPDSSWSAFLAYCRTAIRELAGNTQELHAIEGRTAAVMGVGLPAMSLAESEESPVVVLPMSGTMITREGTALDKHRLSALADLDAIAARLSSVCPPFGYMAYDRRSERIIAGTDALGLRHIYFARKGQTTLAASSSFLLAKILGREVDEDACSIYASLGCFLRERTMFQGVEKLPAGRRVRLDEGRATTIDDYVPLAVRRSGVVTSVDEAADTGTRALREILGSYYETAPHLRLELSGGLDSRLVLAVAQSLDIDGISVLTIGPLDSPDVEVATRIVKARSLKGQLVPFSLLDVWEPDEAAARVHRAAMYRDFAANPMSAAIQGFVGEQAPTQVQVTGQGGELGRGSYFAGQRARADFDADMAERLVRWRLTVNQAVDRSLLNQQFIARGQQRLRADIWSYFEDLDADWPRATDQIYLFGRMQRWAGAVYSQMNTQPDHLAPFFHPAHVEWASRLADPVKRGSRTFVAMLDRLSPDLARVPLDSGLTPAQLVDHSLLGRSRSIQRDIRRAARKVQQRIEGRRYSPGGTQTLAQQVMREWRHDPPINLQHVSWLDSAYLDRVLEGNAELDAVSVAFLVNLDGAMATTRR